MDEAGNYLEILTPTDLLAFLRHLELGDEHLKHFLSEEDYKQLLSLETLDPKTAAQLDADRPELAGNVTLIMNSFFTATVGLWLGLSGFLGKSLHSMTYLVSVFSFATIGGAYIGVQNYRFTIRLGKTYVRKSKLQALQLDILKHIIGERGKEIQEKTDELNACLQKLQITETDKHFPVTFENQKAALEWLQRLDSILDNSVLAYKNNASYQIFAQEIEETRKELKGSFEEGEKAQEFTEGVFPFFKKMIRHEGEEHIPRVSWFRSNLKNLMISFIPTLFGAFGSTFVYFSGVPTIAKEFERQELYSLLTHPKIKQIELISSTLITLYFVCTFLYLNFKGFIRNRRLDEGDEMLIRQKNQLRKLDDRLLKIKEALSHMKRLATIFGDLKKM